MPQWVNSGALKSGWGRPIVAGFAGGGVGRRGGVRAVVRAQGEDVAGAWAPAWMPACLAGPAGMPARSAANWWSRLVFCAGYKAVRTSCAATAAAARREASWGALRLMP